MRFDTLLRASRDRHAVVILGVSEGVGLSMVRSLSAAGVPPLALDADPGAPGLRSRLCAARLCPDPSVDDEAFVVYLERLGPQLARRAVLLPTGDLYARPLARNVTRLSPWFAAPFSGWDEARRTLEAYGEDGAAGSNAAGAAATGRPAAGPDVFVSYLDAQSRPLAQFTGRTLRWRPAGSLAVNVAESIWLPEVAETALRLLREAGQHGMSQVESRYDAAEGRHVVVRVGPCREPWFSLATAAGVDPALSAYRDAIGEPYLTPRQAEGLRSYAGMTAAGLAPLRDPAPAALLAWRRLSGAIW